MGNNRIKLPWPLSVAMSVKAKTKLTVQKNQLLINSLLINLSDLPYTYLDPLECSYQIYLTSCKVEVLREMQISMKYNIKSLLTDHFYLAAFSRDEKIHANDKAEFTEEGIFFTNRFPSLRTFVNKKVGI